MNCDFSLKVKGIFLPLYLVIVVTFTLGYISCEQSGDRDMPGRHFYFSKNKDIESYNGFSRNVIYPRVLDYAFNENFILAKQNPDKPFYCALLGFDLYSRFTAYADYLRDPNFINTSEGSNYKDARIFNDSQNYKLFKLYNSSENNTSRDANIYNRITDSLCNNDPILKKIFSQGTNYWIIDIKKDSLIGPLIYKEFLSECNRLHIPKELKLSEE